MCGCVVVIYWRCCNPSRHSPSFAFVLAFPSHALPRQLPYLQATLEMLAVESSRRWEQREGVVDDTSIIIAVVGRHSNDTAEEGAGNKEAAAGLAAAEKANGGSDHGETVKEEEASRMLSDEEETKASEAGLNGHRGSRGGGSRHR